MPEIRESDHYELHEVGDLERLKSYLMPGTENTYNIGLLAGDLCWLLFNHGGHSKEEVIRFLERYIGIIEPQLKKKYDA